jgi:hypothetical protein
MKKKPETINSSKLGIRVSFIKRFKIDIKTEYKVE